MIFGIIVGYEQWQHRAGSHNFPPPVPSSYSCNRIIASYSATTDTYTPQFPAAVWNHPHQLAIGLLKYAAHRSGRLKIKLELGFQVLKSRICEKDVNF